MTKSKQKSRWKKNSLASHFDFQFSSVSDSFFPRTPEKFTVFRQDKYYLLSPPDFLSPSGLFHEFCGRSFDFLGAGSRGSRCGRSFCCHFLCSTFGFPKEGFGLPNLGGRCGFGGAFTTSWFMSG